MQDSSTISATAITSALSARQRYLRQLAFSFLCWSVVILLEASTVFAADLPWGRNLPAVHYIAWATFNWFLMIPLTPPGLSAWGALSDRRTEVDEPPH